MQDPTQNQSQQDKNAQSRRIQYEITMADSDSKKKEAEIEAEKMLLRRLDNDLARLNVNISEKKQAIINLESEKMKIDNDIKALRKKLNELR